MLIHYDGIEVPNFTEETKTKYSDFAKSSIFTQDYNNFKIHEIIYFEMIAINSQNLFMVPNEKKHSLQRRKNLLR